MNRLTQERTLHNRNQLEKWLGSSGKFKLPAPKVTVKYALSINGDACIFNVVVAHLFNSTSPVGFSKDLLAGHFSSPCLKKSGPLHHVSLLAKFAALIPLVTQSAGFWAVGIYCHFSGRVLVWISPTLLAIKGLNLRLLPRTYHNTSKLSDQKMQSFICTLRTFVILDVSLTPITASISSNLGMLVAVVGATRVFAAIMLLEIEPSS